MDDKKTDEAAKKYAKEKEKICKELAEKHKSAISLCNWVTVNPDAAFKDGIDWLLNNLWHPANEIPCEGKYIVVEYNIAGTFKDYISFKRLEGFIGYDWIPYSKSARVARWLYIEDLLPKEVNNERT